MATFFIVDIDGTICDSMPRVKKICDKAHATRYDNLDEIWTKDVMEDFLKEENIMTDGVIPGADCLFSLASKCNATIKFLTGRSEYGRHGTRRWLTEIFKAPEDIPLIMRPLQMRGVNSSACKQYVFLKEAYYPRDTYIFFEDELDTAKAYSRYGLVLKSPECWAAIGDNL